MNLTLKKKFALIALLLCCITIVSCAQKEPELRKVNKSEHSTNQLQKEIESELYDTSGQNNHEFGGGIVENSEYIFYTTETALAQIEKDTMEKSVIQQWEKDSNRTISLYCTESELYYIQDMREVYLIRLEDEKQRLICTSEMLEQEGYTFPEIWGMAVYSGHIYLELCGFDIVQCEFNGHIGDKIARDARSGAFWGNAFFYGKRSSNEIYRVDLKSMEESVVREKKYEERVQYNDIFTIDNNLYYECEGTIYLYEESGKDVKIIEDSGIHVDGKDAIYYIKEQGNVEYLYKFNVQTKQISSRKIQEVITDEDYITEARVICNMLFYKKRVRDEEEDHIEMWGADIVADAGRWSNKKKVVSLNVLKKNGIRISSISGMKIYHNKLYLYEIIYGYVIEFTPEKNKIKLIAKCVRDADFFNESLYYVDESKRCIYKVNLETGKEEVARQGVEKGEKGFIYSDILSVGGRLYYLRKDKKQIFCYSENREDVIIGEKMKYSRLIESIDNKLYYCCYEKETYDANNSFYLGSYDGNENSILRLLPEDYYLPAMVIGNKLYYQVIESEEDNTNNEDYYKECSLFSRYEYAEYINDYFPYKNNQKVSFGGRLLDYGVEGKIILKFHKEMDGKKGELWRVTMVDIEDAARSKEERKDVLSIRNSLYYFFVTRTRIYWIERKKIHFLFSLL